MTNTNIEPASAVDFLNNLRSATASLHTQLESLAVSQSIISPEISTTSYAIYLNLMYDVIRAVESNVFPLVRQVLSDIDDRRKTNLITDDLNHIDFAVQPTTMLFQGDFSVPFALGIMYVIEGSTLGGRFLLKNVQKELGYTADGGASYFAGYQDRTGYLWKNFLGELVRYETENDAADEIIEGANFAFTTIYNHFSACVK